MQSFRAVLLTMFALMALCSPSFAAGLCVAVADAPQAIASQPGTPANLPSPCDLQGGKRVMPLQADIGQHQRYELLRATQAQWALGLSDVPMRRGQMPATELPPPRFGLMT